jgi:hypothetical protein
LKSTILLKQFSTMKTLHMFLEHLSSLRVGRLIWVQNLLADRQSFFILIRAVLFSLEDRDLLVLLVRDPLLIVHQVLLLVLELRLSVLVSQLVLELRNETFVNQMLQRKISKQQNEELNISSHFSPQLIGMMIHFVVRRVSSERNKKKMWMISDRHSWIVLVKKSNSGISSL